MKHRGQKPIRYYLDGRPKQNVGDHALGGAVGCRKAEGWGGRCVEGTGEWGVEGTRCVGRLMTGDWGTGKMRGKERNTDRIFPTRSPEARCCPSGLTRILRTPFFPTYDVSVLSFPPAVNVNKTWSNITKIWLNIEKIGQTSSKTSSNIIQNIRSKYHPKYGKISTKIVLKYHLKTRSNIIQWSQKAEMP